MICKEQDKALSESNCNVVLIKNNVTGISAAIKDSQYFF
jgi:hypothetical protein